MPDINKKLNDFTQMILDDAGEESKKILDEMQEMHDASMHSAEDVILNDTFKYIKSEISNIKAEAGRRVSKQVLENKNILSKRRMEIADSVFKDVREKLKEFVNSPEYVSRLVALIDDGAGIAGWDEKVTVMLRSEDMRLKDELIKKIKIKNCEFKEGDFLIGGVIIECPSKNLSIDETFDTAMKDLDGHFAEIFGVNLADE